MEDLFALAGIRKNHEKDCWEFVPKTPVVSKPSSSNASTAVEAEDTKTTHKASETKASVKETTSSNSTTTNTTMKRQTRSATATTTTTNTSTTSTTNVTTASTVAGTAKDASSTVPPPPVTSNNQVPPSPDHHDDGHKRKKSRPRKKRSKSASNPSKDDEVHVKWGQVQEYCFSRSFGFDAVPSNGSYPLGLGELVEQCCFTVDELFAQHQYQQFLATKQAAIPPPPPVVTSPTSNKSKKGQTNTVTNNTAVSVSTKSRVRKDSFDLTTDSDHSSSSSSTTTTTESSHQSEVSRSPQVKAETERIALLRQYIDDSKKNPESAAISEELKSIRQSRDHIGCSCKPIKVDKLNVAKLKSELQHRKHLLTTPFTESIDKLKKNDLMHYLKEALKNCPSCIAANCECIQAEIPCSASACDCVYRPGEPESCENPLGSGSFDPDRVHQYLVYLQYKSLFYIYNTIYKT